MKEGYVPKDQRKKILLMCDDIRLPSGIGTVGRELILGTAHRYNWVNLGGEIDHPEFGKRFDLSEDTNKNTGITDASVVVIPYNGYGDPTTLRKLLEEEQPDAIFLITDPRYWVWLFQIENEIRKQIPIAYLNIWDDLPAPYYNKAFYESCDALFGISKQTVNINKLVLDDKAKGKIIKYVPHGLNPKILYPLKDKENNKEFQEFKKHLLKGKEYDFVVFFNSRNIRRKQVPDTILAFKTFLDKLPKEKAKKCLLLLHTEAVLDHGTDLPAIIKTICPKDNIVITNTRFSVEQINYLHNMADVQILLTSNEGWGLSLTEALLVGNPIIANVTGGMQDQMRFEDENGNWIDFNADFPSNHRGTYKKHGEWAFPVYPTSRSLQGSPPTPYIFDDRCNWEDAADQIMEVYNLSSKERKDKGNKGRNWALSNEAGFTQEHQAQRIIEGMDELFSTWKPREKFEFINATDYNLPVLNHKLIY